jgi:hypothetical protein
MNKSQEQLIKRLGEQAQCYSILHRESQSYYGWLNHFTAIPVIVLSTVAGGANFIFGGNVDATIGIGGISIVVGILQTLSSYFRHPQLSEGHRVCAISYQKMFMNISAELSLPPDQRQDVLVLMGNLRSEIERLSEIAPPIPTSVIRRFKQKYGHDTDVSKPQITNGLERIEVYIPPPPTPELKRTSVIMEPIVAVVEKEVKKQIFKP